MRERATEDVDNLRYSAIKRPINSSRLEDICLSGWEDMVNASSSRGPLVHVPTCAKFWQRRYRKYSLRDHQCSVYDSNLMRLHCWSPRPPVFPHPQFPSPLQVGYRTKFGMHPHVKRYEYVCISSVVFCCRAIFNVLSLCLQPTLSSAARLSAKWPSSFAKSWHLNSSPPSC